MKPFANEPILELRRAPVRARLDEALREHDAKLPLRVPVWIGTDRRDGEELVSTDPGAPDRVVANAAAATPAEVDAALQAAQRGSRVWAATPAERAAAYVRGARVPRARLWVGWNAKKLAKRLNSPLYERIRLARSSRP